MSSALDEFTPEFGLALEGYYFDDTPSRLISYNVPSLLRYMKKHLGWFPKTKRMLEDDAEPVVRSLLAWYIKRLELPHMELKPKDWQQRRPKFFTLKEYEQVIILKETVVQIGGSPGRA